MIVEYQCEWCGKHVRKRRSPATLRGTQPRFCSQACNGASRKGTGAGPTPNHEYDCVVCGKRCQVYRSPSAQTPVTCSLACTGIKQRGAGNGSYSGDDTTPITVTSASSLPTTLARILADTSGSTD